MGSCFFTVWSHPTNIGLLDSCFLFMDHYGDLILIGKDFKFPVWTGSQLNRSGYFAQNPGSEMTSDSMMKIFNCDCSIVMQQTREEREAGKMRGLIDKARRGVAQVHINWQVDYEHMLVTEAPANQ
jgi:hypothetical protein